MAGILDSLMNWDITPEKQTGHDTSIWKKWDHALDAGDNIKRGQAEKERYSDIHPNEKAPTAGQMGVFNKAMDLQSDVKKITTPQDQAKADVQSAQQEATDQKTQNQNETQQTDNQAAAPETPKTANDTASTIVNKQINVDVPKPPVIPEMTKKTTDAVDAGASVSKQVNTVPVWWQSNAMSNGLISFGLNLLSGNDLATSFSQAGKAFEHVAGRDQRQAYAQELLDKGYDKAEVMQYVEDGNAKNLTNPAEKKLREQQLRKAEYENSDEYRNYERQKEQYGMDIQAAQLGISKENAETSRMSAEAAAKTAELKAKAGEQLTPSQKTSIAGQFSTNNKTQLDEYNKRVSSGNQLHGAVTELNKGNTFANNSTIANFLKTEAPNLSPRMSQYSAVLEKSGSSVNNVQRLLDRMLGNGALTAKDAKDLEALAKVQQFIAYDDLADVRAQRDSLIQQGIPESQLRTIPKPAGYDAWKKSQEKPSQVRPPIQRNGQ